MIWNDVYKIMIHYNITNIIINNYIDGKILEISENLSSEIFLNFIEKFEIFWEIFPPHITKLCAICSRTSCAATLSF